MSRTIRIVLLMITVFGLLSVTGCKSLREVQLKYDNAVAYIQSGDYQSAIPLLNECLDYSHEDPEIHYFLGKCYEETGSLSDAIWHLQLAVRFDPSHDASQLALIRVLDKNGQKNKSQEVARTYFKYRRADHAQFMLAGSQLLSNKLVAQAELAFDAALRMAPRNPEPYIRLADYYYMQGDETRGEDYLIKAFRVNPTWPGLSRRMGEKGLRTTIPVDSPNAKPLTPESLEMKRN